MKQQFTAHLWREDNLRVARCLEVDVASQGTSEEEALQNLREALELYLEPPLPNPLPLLCKVEVELGVA